MKQVGIIIILAILLVLIENALLPNKSQISNKTPSDNTKINVVNEANVNIGIGNIPPYSGQIVISINNDIPYFEEKD